MNYELATKNCIVQQCGLFITFEGSEGCGKSTQIARLAEFLRQKNPACEIVLLREPGGTALGEQVRHLLQHADPSIKISAEAELLLFAASRVQLVHEIIQPALKRGAIVLCDRFVDSTTVYQGVARAIDSKKIAAVNEVATNGLLPDVTILLDLNVAVGRERMRERNQNTTTRDRMEQEPEAFYEAVRQGYLELASKEPERWSVIDASPSAEEVSEKILTKLSKKSLFKNFL